MKAKAILFGLFILFLFVLYSRIKFPTEVVSTDKLPDLILENSYTEHFINGKFSFSLNAKKIEIYQKQFLIYDATVRFKDGVVIEADQMEANLKQSYLTARQNVRVSYNNYVYSGAVVHYFIKERKFLGYNGGSILIVGDNKG